MLDGFHSVTKQWFDACFDEPTGAQLGAWTHIVEGRSTLLMAPTGSGKTLAAFLYALDRLMFDTEQRDAGCRVLYISPIKALAVDVERNLRAPLTGLEAVARKEGVPVTPLRVGIRSGDTPQAERTRMAKVPPDILITTPESLYLMLTSKVRSILQTIDVVIIDEIHALVPSKRGTHLFLSLERLNALRTSNQPLQRIGLSATQRPLTDVARLLAGGTVDGESVKPRPIEIVDVGEHKRLDIQIHVPTPDMVNFELEEDLDLDAAMHTEGMTSDGQARSIWPLIYPKLVAQIRAHRSTLIFVNARRSAERLATAINEVAEEEIARAHHGSLAHNVRAEIEDLLKRGQLPAIVATASLELGIDMGAIDLVVQVEAPPSIAAGLQRIGRAQHHVGGIPKGITYPKFRGDLLVCAAASKAMLDGLIEATQYPRNPLDVLAQQVVAIVSMADTTVDELYTLIRQSAPYHELSRGLFESVLDMLSGRYPSDDFADLKPRITWDRISGQLQKRKGAQRLAVINGGTIPDRGLYGVFLAGQESGKAKRVGELDEEMVFESRVGEVFLLGASSWRVEEITHDRVLVSPAPGEPGKMPFWHGDRPGRPLEFGQVVGAFLRTVGGLDRDDALGLLTERYTLDDNGAANLVNYIEEQKEASTLPSDRCIVLERFVDEIGDWRICILSPFGSRVHAPWAMAVRAQLLEEYALELDVVWGDDGIVFRLPEGDSPPAESLFFPAPQDVEERIIQRLADTSLFAARFRENAGRSLLLPKKKPGGRSPLWALRRRAASLLSVASRFRDFPVVLETYRECLKDQFDIDGLKQVLTNIAQRRIQVVVQESDMPSPFSASLMFQYVANFMYEGDAPLAERRAHALTIDQVRLRELLGDAALRELLDGEAIEQIERQCLKLDLQLRHEDDIHDLLLSIGPLDEAQLLNRCADDGDMTTWLERLVRHRRVIKVKMSGRVQYAAAEDAARLRDALGVVSPPGLPEAFLESVDDPLGDLVMRFARNRGPFTVRAIAEHYGLGVGVCEEVLNRLMKQDRLVCGEFLPGGAGIEWCDAGILRRIKRASLAKLRADVQSVEHSAYARFCLEWHGVTQRRRGVDGILDAVDRLQGAPLPATILESDILGARVEDYQPAELDMLLSSGEVIWAGLRPTGPKDGRITFYTANNFDRLAPEVSPLEGEQYDQIRDALSRRGAMFFKHLHAQIGGISNVVLTKLWDLVWNGEVSNDTLGPLRSLLGLTRKKSERPRRRGFIRSHRKLAEPGSEGRWWLLRPGPHHETAPTEHRMAVTQQLLERHGVLTRESIKAEALNGGFSYVYPVLKALEEAGRIRRGFFVEDLSATQFAMPGADDALRANRECSDTPSIACIATTDPANPFGAALPWPDGFSGRLERAPGARLILRDGDPIAFISRSGKALQLRLSDDHITRRAIFESLIAGFNMLMARHGWRVLTFETIDGNRPSEHKHIETLIELGFREVAKGITFRAPSLNSYGERPRAARPR